MEKYKNATLKSIVTDDFRTAAVFEKFSLDFCCGGGATIEQACSKKGLDPALVYAELHELDQRAGGRIPNFPAWPSDELINYIVSVHHKYVREAIPVLLAHTQKVAAVHGERHPEVVEIARHFNAVAKDMAAHMMKEEHVLFPYILELVKARRHGTAWAGSPFGGVQNPIRMMEMEHQAAGDEMTAIRSLSADYTPPDDACTTYRISFRELQLFEEDLHRHVHLENNILFPKAIALEQELDVSHSSKENVQ